MCWNGDRHGTVAQIAVLLRAIRRHIAFIVNYPLLLMTLFIMAGALAGLALAGLVAYRSGALVHRPSRRR